MKSNFEITSQTPTFALSTCCPDEIYCETSHDSILCFSYQFSKHVHHIQSLIDKHGVLLVDFPLINIKKTFENLHMSIDETTMKVIDIQCDCPLYIQIEQVTYHKGGIDHLDLDVTDVYKQLIKKDPNLVTNTNTNDNEGKNKLQSNYDYLWVPKGCHFDNLFISSSHDIEPYCTDNVLKISCNIQRQEEVLLHILVTFTHTEHKEYQLSPSDLLRKFIHQHRYNYWSQGICKNSHKHLTSTVSPFVETFSLSNSQCDEKDSESCERGISSLLLTQKIHPCIPFGKLYTATHLVIITSISTKSLSQDDITIIQQNLDFFVNNAHLLSERAEFLFLTSSCSSFSDWIYKYTIAFPELHYFPVKEKETVDNTYILNLLSTISTQSASFKHCIYVDIHTFRGPFLPRWMPPTVEWFECITSAKDENSGDTNFEIDYISDFVDKHNVMILNPLDCMFIRVIDYCKTNEEFRKICDNYTNFCGNSNKN